MENHILTIYECCPPSSFSPRQMCYHFSLTEQSISERISSFTFGLPNRTVYHTDTAKGGDEVHHYLYYKAGSLGSTWCTHCFVSCNIERNPALTQCFVYGSFPNSYLRAL